MIADNSAAAVYFRDRDGSAATLRTVRVRERVARACLYLLDGTYFDGYVRDDQASCPARLPPEGLGTNQISFTAPVRYEDRSYGTAWVERDLRSLGPRVAVTAGAAAAMFVLAVGLAFLLARPLSRSISRPIAELATAATRVGADIHAHVPPITSSQDEVGALVRAFEEMVARIKRANEALVREIEERRKVEGEREALLLREREASRLKDEFLAAVSHELRTPLNAIMGWIQILGTTSPSDETRRKALASIARNAQAQTRVIEDLVDVSRIVAGKLHLRFERLDLRGPVDAAVEVVRPSADARGLQLVVSSPPLPCIVDGDRDRLQQIVWNLLSNAVKFTEPGGAVAVTTKRAASRYEITVADTGGGIAAGFLPFVFDRFRQADGSLTRAHGGLGLGLAIVKELTEKHGGSVDVSSEGLGHGAVFTVRLPVAVEPTAATAAPAHAGDAAGREGSPQPPPDSTRSRGNTETEPAPLVEARTPAGYQT
jgi:signal transduction histidine kinase